MKQRKRVEDIVSKIYSIEHKEEQHLDMFYRFVDAYKRDRVLDVIEQFETPLLKPVFDAFVMLNNELEVADVFEKSKDFLLKHEFHEHLGAIVRTLGNGAAVADRIKPMIDNYHNKDFYCTIAESIRQTDLNKTEWDILDFLEVYKEDTKHVQSTLWKAYNFGISEGKVANKVFKIAIKYKDNNFNKILPKLHLDYEICLDEFLTDRAFNAIKEDPDFINALINKKYVSCLNLISYKFEYDEMDIAIDTHNFIENFHRNRTIGQRMQIKNSFFDELNRAVEQGYNHKEKVEMMEIYCKEVKEQMLKRADEIMVVTDG